MAYNQVEPCISDSTRVSPLEVKKQHVTQGNANLKRWNEEILTRAYQLLRVFQTPNIQQP